VTRTEHLLTTLAEECAEVAQRCSKALRFGLVEKQPGQDLTNAQRIEAEMADLIAVYGMLVDLGHVQPLVYLSLAGKRRKVESYLAYSATCGTLTD